MMRDYLTMTRIKMRACMGMWAASGRIRSGCFLWVG